mmetsp:Transcript_63276/g.193573  ORF Transcript_63276/g.193573 Transcript_63276/m.193573 type:complete len:220 (+) Transcript_63276:227-886(+)
MWARRGQGESCRSFPAALAATSRVGRSDSLHWAGARQVNASRRVSPAGGKSTRLPSASCRTFASAESNGMHVPGSTRASITATLQRLGRRASSFSTTVRALCNARVERASQTVALSLTGGSQAATRPERSAVASRRLHVGVEWSLRVSFQSPSRWNTLPCCRHTESCVASSEQHWRRSHSQPTFLYKLPATKGNNESAARTSSPMSQPAVMALLSRVAG